MVLEGARLAKHLQLRLEALQPTQRRRKERLGLAPARVRMQVATRALELGLEVAQVLPASGGGEPLLLCPLRTQSATLIRPLALQPPLLL